MDIMKRGGLQICLKSRDTAIEFAIQFHADVHVNDLVKVEELFRRPYGNPCSRCCGGGNVDDDAYEKM